MESSNNSSGQDANNCPPADRGSGNGGRGGGGGRGEGGGLVKTVVDMEIVKEVIIGITTMKTTTGEISSLVENQQWMDMCLIILENAHLRNTFEQ